MLWRDGNGSGGINGLLDETRELLTEATRLVEGSLGNERVGKSGASGSDATILTLYDELRERLEGVDERAVTELLARIARNLEELARLGDEVARVRRLRDAIGSF